MKRTIAFLTLILVFSFSLGFAENAEERGEKVFKSLVDVYETELNYLEHKQYVWGELISLGDKEADEYWFNRVFILHSFSDVIDAVSFFSDVYSIDISNQNYFKQVFVPLKDAFGINTASIAITEMLYKNDEIPQIMQAIKADIRTLMKEYPDYSDIIEIQEFYKAASRIVDYATDHGNESFIHFTDKVAEFRDEKRTIKSNFEFIFDWPEMPFIMKNEAVNESINAIINADAIKKEKEYQNAVSLFEAGDYWQAIKIFQSFPDYKESKEYIERLKEPIYQKALALEQEGKDEEAFQVFKSISNYKDSKKHLMKLFDQLARLVSCRQDNKYDNSISEASYEYAQDGSCVVTVKDFYKGNDLRSTATIKIDKNGKYISGKQRGAFAMTSKKLYSQSSDTYTTTTEYDDHNNIVLSKTIYDPGYMKHLNPSIQKYSNTYDSHDSLIKRIQYRNGEPLYVDTYEHEYNDIGQKIQTISKSDARSGEWVIKYRYNDYGKLINETTKDENGNLIYTIDYKYDLE